MTLPLDHFGSDDRTFDNRFWVSESGYEGAGSPVFIYDIGEGDGSDTAPEILQEGWFKDMVDSFGGIGIALEHRYYGASTPVNITIDTDPEDLVFLTVEQALADVAVFAANFSRPTYPDIDLTPSSTPWIFIGGSYPGIRAALMRDRYPDTIFASYASSAPVQAQVDMSVYFEPIHRGMRAYGFSNCTADVHLAVTFMDTLLAHPASAAKLKTQFLGRNAAKNSNGDFAAALAAIWSDWQNDGVEGNIRGFCDWIETARDANPHTNHTTVETVAGAAGWGPSRGAAFVVSQWASWTPFATLVGSDCEGPVSNTTTDDDDDDEEPTCDLSAPWEDADTIAWMWQYCTQWGFLQSANLGPTQLTSRYNSLAYQQALCRRQFPSAGALLPDWPAAQALNDETGGWDVRPSNTFWTGGEYDPWRALSPLSGEEGAPAVVLTLEAPACNVSSADGGAVFGYVLEDAQHCADLDDSEKAREVQGYFKDALKGWLECFQPGGGY